MRRGQGFLREVSTLSPHVGRVRANGDGGRVAGALVAYAHAGVGMVDVELENVAEEAQDGVAGRAVVAIRSVHSQGRDPPVVLLLLPPGERLPVDGDIGYGAIHGFEVA